tara:strand:+ start:184 stop:591 length:408 start_codon:yes stop_codon:yes gene_type:complete
VLSGRAVAKIRPKRRIFGAKSPIVPKYYLDCLKKNSTLRDEGSVPSDAALCRFMETDMKNFVLALGVISAFSVAQANAQTTVKDADGNGVYSMEELVAAYPGLTQEDFTAADTNADGAIDADELAAAIEAGNIPG